MAGSGFAPVALPTRLEVENVKCKPPCITNSRQFRPLLEEVHDRRLSISRVRRRISVDLPRLPGGLPPVRLHPLFDSFVCLVHTAVRPELALNSAQLFDFGAGDLSKLAQGGAQFLSTQPYYPGINDSLGADPQGKQFTPNVFTIYTSFQNSRNPQQASIARGEQIFNTEPLTISNVPGLTTGNQQIAGTCTTCHDTFNVGNHSFPLPLDIGTSRSPLYETDPNILAGLKELQMPVLPVFELTCTQGPLTGNTYYTSDPGKALITGQCSDIGRGKGLILRGLAARAPYFHDGVAANLQQVVNFYNQRFQIGLTQQQMQDLVNFLQTL
jgi:cytochrome c peroxidase